MMFDVDKLKEALDSWSIDPAIPGDGLNHKQRMRIAAAVRLVVAGQPLALCVPHNKLPTGAALDSCDNYILVGQGFEPCEVVEGWWMPTGKDET